MNRIKSVSVREIVLPLKTVFATALGRKGYLHSVLVSVVLDNGKTGISEIPTSFSRKEETIPVIRGVLADLKRELQGAPIETYDELVRGFRQRFPHTRMTISGLEIALFRAFLKNRRTSEYRFFGPRVHELETDITVPFVPDPPSLTKWISFALRKGFRVFKVKVSGHVREDKRFLSLVHAILRKAEIPFQLRLDGNQGYTTKTFFQLADWIHTKGWAVELFEQPLPKHDLEGLRRITKGAILPVVLDESVESVSDFKRALDAEACNGVNIKIAKSGIAESLEIAHLARANGLKLMIGCMTETMVGLSAAIHLAAGKEFFDYIDLDAIFLLHHRNKYEDITIANNRFLFE